MNSFHVEFTNNSCIHPRQIKSKIKLAIRVFVHDICRWESLLFVLLLSVSMSVLPPCARPAVHEVKRPLVFVDEEHPGVEANPGPQ